MADQLSYYDILGVEPGASADEIRLAYETKIGVLAPAMISGAPSKVVAVVDRARTALEVAKQTLLDPAARQRYDTEIAIQRPGTGLVDPVPVPSQGSWTSTPTGGRAGMYQVDVLVEGLGMIADWLAPRPAPPRRVVVPDARGLFVAGARRLLIAAGLRTEVVQLTRDPIPVEGLVVDQSLPAGTKAHRASTVTVQVWHPARRPSQRS
jgi:DnaJ domain/PASTA domain